MDWQALAKGSATVAQAHGCSSARMKGAGRLDMRTMRAAGPVRLPLRVCSMKSLPSWTVNSQSFFHYGMGGKRSSRSVQKKELRVAAAPGLKDCGGARCNQGRTADSQPTGRQHILRSSSVPACLACASPAALCCQQGLGRQPGSCPPSGMQERHREKQGTRWLAAGRRAGRAGRGCGCQVRRAPVPCPSDPRKVATLPSHSRA